MLTVIVAVAIRQELWRSVAKQSNSAKKGENKQQNGCLYYVSFFV